MKQRGFTLIEVMVALAILALGLTMILRSTAGSVRRGESDRMTTVATFLARGKMLDVEEALHKEGFTAAGQAGIPESGTFEDEGWAQIQWKVEVREVDLPTPEQMEAMAKQQAAAAQPGSGSGTGTGTGTGTGGSGSSSSSGETSGLFGMLSMFGGNAPSAQDVKGASFIGGGGYALIQSVFKESLRKVVLTVSWRALGVEDSLKVVEYVTDPDAMNRVIGGASGAGAGDYGADNAAPTGSGSGTGKGTGTGTGKGTGIGRPGGFGK